ncbi:hypothetical protein PVAP13_6KG218600 [Panicum virgatum]|uniref:Uncharacterized protein n=1 Tax=Panicum virgatum TaxID=38727 RepID=A0A8T0REA2_PANVG|nr:hypothetical protein PVAP13_6KG218600 [Panicum virgatum]
MSTKRIGECSESSNRPEKALKSSGQFDTELSTPRIPETNDTFEEEFGSSNDSCQGVWSELSKEVVSNLSKSVVSLASFQGDKLNCACTGMVVMNYSVGVDILTSADLIRSPHDPNDLPRSLRIQVHLPNRKEGIGRLKHYDLGYNVALVYTESFPEIEEIFLGQFQIKPHSKVVAVGRGFNSGKLMATAGTVTDERTEKYMISTCKITRSGIGGLLIDFDGNFVGINFYSFKGNPFLPRNGIAECLGVLWDVIEQDRTIDRSTIVRQKPILPNLEEGESCGEVF